MPVKYKYGILVMLYLYFTGMLPHHLHKCTC